MKKRAIHTSLKNIVLRYGWNVVGTNASDYIKKAHLLEMRRGLNPLVFDINPVRNNTGYGNEKFFARYHGNVIGSEWNSNFYGITYEGLMTVLELFPEVRNDIEDMLYDLLDHIFNSDIDINDLKLRGMK